MVSYVTHLAICFNANTTPWWDMESVEAKLFSLLRTSQFCLFCILQYLKVSLAFTGIKDCICCSRLLNIDKLNVETFKSLKVKNNNNSFQISRAVLGCVENHFFLSVIPVGTGTLWRVHFQAVRQHVSICDFVRQFISLFVPDFPRRHSSTASCIEFIHFVY